MTDSKRPSDPALGVNDDAAQRSDTGTLLASQRAGVAGTQLRQPKTPHPPSTGDTEEGAGDATEFTEYRHVTQSNHSTGFNKAKEIAQAALKEEGTFLKKRFVLEEVLGRGGMGVVYKTRDLRKVEADDDNPYIATKVLSRSFKDHPDAFVTLQQEAVKSQKLAHPNIVTVYDFDRDGSTIYMTMELLDGEPLDKLLKQHQALGIPKAQALDLFADMCAALTYAHDQGLIHADFKPGNIFVMRHGGAKVLDFGIARAASQEARKGKFDVGELGAITPAYATIEMVDGDPPSFSDDVYALACVTYEMFSGRHPFARASAKDAQQANLKPQRLNGLSRRQWRALNAALSFDKRSRTPTVEQFMRAFLPRKISTAFKIAAGLTVFALVGAAWFGFQQYESQQQIARTIKDRLLQAQQCFDRGDFTCAVQQSQVAVNLDSANSQAAELLQIATLAEQEHSSKQRVAQSLEDAESCLSSHDYECARVKVAEVLKREPNNPLAKALQVKTTGLIEGATIAGFLTQADACLLSRDLECVKLFADKANAVNPHHPANVEFSAKFAVTRSTVARQVAEREAAVARLLSDGTQCLSRRDFNCAVGKADAAAKLMPNHAQAVALKQRAVLAAEQYRTNNAKADDLTAQASACLKAGNFNCAIAKSDSALDIMPQHAQAQQLKQQATVRQEQLKRSIAIK
jgi:serine/threonine protein kinase